MKEKLLDFLHSLSTYDFLYFAAVLVGFILLILFSLLLRKKPTIALLMLLCSLLELSLAPTIGFNYFHNYLYTNKITIEKAFKLQFVNAVLIEGNITNQSNFNFKSCKIKATILKDTHNRYKNLIFRLKPITTKTLIVKDIPKGADATFKFLIEPFKYQKDFNVSVDGVCK